MDMPHATYRIPDGDTVPQPVRPAGPAITRRQLLCGWLCAAIVVAAPLLAAVLR